MSFDTLSDLNWLAVLVAALAYFALGAIWYTPQVFGRPWMRATGFDMSGEQRMSQAMYLVPLVAYLVAAIATAMLARATGSESFGEGLVLGLVVGVGYALVLSGVTALFDPQKPQPGVWFLINGAYHLLGLVIVAVIVSLWD